MRLQNYKNIIHYIAKKLNNSFLFSLHLEAESFLSLPLKCHLVHIYATCNTSTAQLTSALEAVSK